MATNTPTPITLSESAEDKVNPITRPVGDGRFKSRKAYQKRLSDWADAVAIANRNPSTMLIDGQMVDVVEIGPPAFADDREIWERQPTESGKQWRMFRIYRDLEPWKRTKKQVQRQIGLAHSNGTGREIGHAATQFRWDERVQAFDAVEDRRMTEELYQRKLRARIATADVGQKMRSKAAAALSAMRAIIYKYIVDEDGNKVRVKRSALSPNEIVRLAEIGVKLERLGLGENDTEFGKSILSLTQVNQTVNISDQKLLEQAHEIIEARAGSFGPVGTD